MMARRAAKRLLGHWRGKDGGVGGGVLRCPYGIVDSCSFVGVSRKLTNSSRQHIADFRQSRVLNVSSDCESSSVLFAVKTPSLSFRFCSSSSVILDITSPFHREPGIISHLSFTSLSKRSYVSASFADSGPLETVQDETKSNSRTVSDVKVTAMPILAEYLRNVRGIPDEDADFVSKNCHIFLSKLVDTVTSSVAAKECIGTPTECIRSVIEKEDLKSHSDVPTVKGNPNFPTLADMARLSASPLEVTGLEGMRKSMGIVDGLGWPRNRVWETLELNTELLKWTAEQLLGNVCILEKIGVKRKHMLSFIEDPTVFTADLEERLTPLLQYLDTIGIECDVLGDLMKFNPQGLIKMPLSNFRERVDYLLGLGLSSTEVEKGMRVFPQLVHLRLSNLSQKIKYFESIGVDKDSMVKIAASVPSIFRHSIEKNLVPKVKMLETLGVVEQSLVKVISQYPQFFGCSIDNLRQKLVFFETNGLTGDRLVKMITWHPRAFSFSVRENLSKKLQFLIGKGFVVKSTPLARALAACITISTDSLEARFQNLQALGFTANEVCELVKKQPTIFCLSEKTICVKVDYLVKNMKRSVREIIKCPGYLLYSLELRTKPRHRVFEVLGSKGLLRDGAYSLSTILQPSEKVFVKRFVKLDPDCLDVFLRIGQTIGEPAVTPWNQHLNFPEEAMAVQ